MVENPPEGYQRIIPYLMYADAAAALAFLCTAFGFEERFRLPGPGGVVGHAEIGYQGNVVMLANVTEEQTGHASPRDLPARHSTVLCYVDDVDGHFERARAAGAKIVAEPEDKYYGDRMYSAADPEGHQWFFATHTRDVPLEEMMPQEA